MKNQDMLIFGAGGFAREVAWLIECCNEKSPQYKIVGFIDDTDKQKPNDIFGVPIYTLHEAHSLYPESKIVAAIGDPKGKELAVQKADKKGFVFERIIHPKTEMSKWVQIDEGTIICAGTILTTNIRVGKHVHINLNCTIGHNAIIQDYTTLAPGVHVSGWVHIGKRVYIGTGAVIINGTQNHPLIIGDDVIIGAGACVVSSLEANHTYVGVPAKKKI